MKKYSSNGDRILKELDSIENFANWMYEVVSKQLKGNILEVGSGIGTYSQLLINDPRFSDSNVTLSDIDANYTENLAKRYDKYPNVKVRRLDIESVNDTRDLKEHFDSIFALNVLEHIKNDDQALEILFNMLKKDGVLILILPNYKFLFNTLDKTVNHFRRYNKKDIIAKVGKTGFKLSEISYFNSIGVLGWFLNGNILKKEEIDTNAGLLLRLYDKVIPIWKHIERLIFSRLFGLSLLVILKK